MSNKYYLGIDTSNYTTSVSLVDSNGNLILNLKAPLPVKNGEVGLRQSDAVFAHIKNFPHLMTKVRENIEDGEIAAVGVSSRPRNQEGSYMPVFSVGNTIADAVSAFVKAPIYRFSHQCGHIMAAIYSSSSFHLLDGRAFASYHVSGGTTELLRARYVDEVGFQAEIVGGTADLNAGQVIDRIGVFMGLKFPCGAEMERLALLNTEKIQRKKISSVDTFVNLSGLENLAKKLYSDTNDKSLTSAFVFDYISRAVISMSDAYKDKYGESEFVFAGGVMSNVIIKKELSSRYNSYFAAPDLSRDNAVGIAYLTYLAENKKGI